MKSFDNVSDLEKILRQALITQSTLAPERVLNSLSMYGTELDKLLSENICESIDQNDTTMLFELTSREATSDVSMTETQDNDLNLITYYKAFRLKVIMYGNSSSDIALQLAARFRTEEVRNDLYEQGIYLEKITDPFIINEYKNETMWLRNDVDIDIGVKFSFTPITTDASFANISELNIINEEATNV